VYENNVYIEDRWPTDRPTDLVLWKTLNGRISATGHPIHFMFGSTVGFSRSADRMDLLPVGPNPRWRLADQRWPLAAVLEIWNGHISATDHPIDFVFDPSVGFSGKADRMVLLPVVPNPRIGHLPSWKISNDHISGMSYPIHFHELQSSVGGLQEKMMRKE